MHGERGQDAQAGVRASAVTYVQGPVGRADGRLVEAAEVGASGKIHLTAEASDSRPTAGVDANTVRRRVCRRRSGHSGRGRQSAAPTQCAVRQKESMGCVCGGGLAPSLGARGHLSRRSGAAPWGSTDRIRFAARLNGDNSLQAVAPPCSAPRHGAGSLGRACLSIFHSIPPHTIHRV